MKRSRGKLWYRLVALTLTQWSYARVLEHLPPLLKACASLDGRMKVNVTDYRILLKVLQPMQLERYIIQSFGLEAGRIFNGNLYCLLVEFASHGYPTVNTICEDYKVAPLTVERVMTGLEEWCFIKPNSPRRVIPTERTQKVLELCGVKQKW